MKKICWLNINTGEFSNSWTNEDYPKKQSIKDLESPHHTNELKLIEYECLSDDKFEFNKHMVIK